MEKVKQHLLNITSFNFKFEHYFVTHVYINKYLVYIQKEKRPYYRLSILGALLHNIMPLKYKYLLLDILDDLHNK